MIKIIIFAFAILLLVVFINATQVSATYQDQCNEVFTYTNQVDDNRVEIDTINTGASGNPDSILVQAKTGYLLTEVLLTVDNDNQGDLHNYTANFPGTFNPNPGEDINAFKVKVKKICASPTPSSTPTVSPTPTSLPSVTPTATPSNTPVETMTPTPTPEVRVVTENKNDPTAPGCFDIAPAKIPNIFVEQTGNKGELRVKWIPTGGTKAHIFYGLEVGNPKHSLIDTSNDGDEIIRNLVSGKHYWFSVTNGDGCGWSNISDWYDPLVL